MEELDLRDYIVNDFPVIEKPKYLFSTGYVNRSMLRSPKERVKRLYMLCNQCNLPFLNMAKFGPKLPKVICQCKVSQHR